MKVAVDAMTCERGVEEAMRGIRAALAADASLEVQAVGHPDALGSLVRAHDFGGRLQLVEATEVIGMDDEPGAAFKSKKNASVTVAVRQVKEGKADAALSPGNTGASMTAATLVLGRIEGVRRPAILTMMPTGNAYTGLLDSGAVVDCRPEDLAQWALMGSLYMELVRGVARPRVGLLSIGEEESKGNALTHEAAPLIKQLPLHFIGNVEGRDLFNGHCDVAVCDGFVGNVVLKTAEGLYKMMMGQMKEAFGEAAPLAKLGGWLARPAFRRMRDHISPDLAGGAALLGVAGNFIITHGAANRVMIQNAVRVSAELARQDLVGNISQAVAKLGQGQA